jgi:hypothetical protein
MTETNKILLVVLVISVLSFIIFVASQTKATNTPFARTKCRILMYESIPGTVSDVRELEPIDSVKKILEYGEFLGIYFRDKAVDTQNEEFDG